jgi:hypothetical protein
MRDDTAPAQQREGAARTMRSRNQNWRFCAIPARDELELIGRKYSIGNCSSR